MTDDELADAILLAIHEGTIETYGQAPDVAPTMASLDNIGRRRYRAIARRLRELLELPPAP